MLLSRLLGRRWGRGRTVVFVSVAAGGTFIAMAMWLLELSGAAVAQFLLISVVGLVAIILAALLGVAFIVLIRKAKQALQRR